MKGGGERNDALEREKTRDKFSSLSLLLPTPSHLFYCSSLFLVVNLSYNILKERGRREGEIGKYQKRERESERERER